MTNTTDFLAAAIALILTAAVQFAAMADEHPAPSRHTYKTVGDRELTVDVFEPTGKAPSGGRPAIVFFHGGGWVFGKPADYHAACRRYAEKGLVVLAFEYRLSIKEDGSYPHPDITPVESTLDARSAMRWLRANATKFGVDPDRIAVAGRSAGGQLAMATVLLDKLNEKSDDLSVDPAANLLILYSSNFNTLEQWVDRILAKRRNEIWSISPHHNLKAGVPPTIAFHGTEDDTVPYWVVLHFRKKTTRLGNDFTLVPIEGKKHLLGEEDGPYGVYLTEDVLKRTDEFLEKHGYLD
ncbi:alpha/beta hydrolase [Stratiformator vulcanicus]|uniref:Carboxylesterase NlhH n=1 Tax=Stratiformator vulcanicus TaxID=2527980 RepID=A0A517QYQ7_9PLAN|nr:alpha/beta hydrolase [Stratiformator vulcanicus]QDT36786.1 Carboxylesterase NlhH [Stratiformator vulcanicus]